MSRTSQSKEGRGSPESDEESKDSSHLLQSVQLQSRVESRRKGCSSSLSHQLSSKDPDIRTCVTFQKETFLSAKKAVWILCFAPLLQQAILKISCSTADAAFLKEYSNSFGGLSNVKGLAISILFTWDDSIEVHGRDRDGN